MQDFASQMMAGLPQEGMPPEPGMDPAAMGMDPAMGGMPPEQTGSPYPSTDPAFVDSLLEQLLSARDQDHQMLAQDQESAVQQSQMFQALVGGAPMGPGAGQDAQSVGFDPTQLPMPPQVA